jgi:hypothetical protein
VRRGLEGLGLLEASRNPIDELLKIAPVDMTNEQLEVAMAFCKRNGPLGLQRCGAEKRDRAGDRSQIRRGSGQELLCAAVGAGGADHYDCLMFGIGAAERARS